MLLFGNFTFIGFFVTAVSILIGFTVHEFTHAWVANQFGDDTPKLMGRLSLNPLAHLDPLGTIFLLLAGFGWGKPVIVNPRNFENPKIDNLTVSLAGPISNFILAVIGGLLLRFIPNISGVAQLFLETFVFFNLVLMIFNFLPIPPLDGSKILSIFLPEEHYIFIQQIGIYILFALIIFSSAIPIVPLILSKGVGFFFALIVGHQPILI